MFHRWNNIPLEIPVEITKISAEDLPTLIGLNDSLDKKIAEILCNFQEKYYWLYYREHRALLISPKLTVLINKIAHKDADVGEIYIKVHSSGYCDVPNCEGDDERIVQEVKLSFYDDGDLVAVNDAVILSDMVAEEFDMEIYNIELPESCKYYGGDIDFYYDMRKEGLI